MAKAFFAAVRCYFILCPFSNLIWPLIMSPNSSRFSCKFHSFRKKKQNSHHFHTNIIMIFLIQERRLFQDGSKIWNISSSCLFALRPFTEVKNEMHTEKQNKTIRSWVSWLLRYPATFDASITTSVVWEMTGVAAEIFIPSTFTYSNASWKALMLIITKRWSLLSWELEARAIEI